ncbi:MAG: hypothetical protein M0R32_09595 [Candidatus Cloacimonetes bacterium]|jgi:hypothetical protein|nr:hypothetical protein [Candidatus Cloacimonadota bacterium]
MKKVPTYIRSFTDRVVETLAEKERAKERDRAARLLKINFNAPEEIKIVPPTAIPREADKKDKFTLLFSAKVSQACGYNIARLADGSEVPYTNMTDESEHGPWRGTYGWEDAVVVGSIKDYDQIIEYGLGRGSQFCYMNCC